MSLSIEVFLISNTQLFWMFDLGDNWYNTSSPSRDKSLRYMVDSKKGHVGQGFSPVTALTAFCPPFSGRTHRACPGMMLDRGSPLHAFGLDFLPTAWCFFYVEVLSSDLCPPFSVICSSVVLKFWASVALFITGRHKASPYRPVALLLPTAYRPCPPSSVFCPLELWGSGGHIPAASQG